MENKGKWTIAKRVGVSLSTVERILERFGRYGHVRLAKIGRPDISRLLTKATAPCVNGLRVTSR